MLYRLVYTCVSVSWFRTEGGCMGRTRRNSSISHDYITHTLGLTNTGIITGLDYYC